MNLCVDCNLLFAELEKHDFCPGFSAVIYGVFDKCRWTTGIAEILSVALNQRE